MRFKWHVYKIRANFAWKQFGRRILARHERGSGIACPNAKPLVGNSSRLNMLGQWSTILQF